MTTPRRSAPASSWPGIQRTDLDSLKTLVITSPAFRQGGPIPKRHTGFGEDVSPAFRLSGLCPEAVSLEVILDDLDIPLIPAYPHWLIWDIPPTEEIPEHIPCGALGPGGAVQGVAYGRNCYRGPRPPFFVRTPHRYLSLLRVGLPPGAGGRSRPADAAEGHGGPCAPGGQHFRNV